MPEVRCRAVVLSLALALLALALAPALQGCQATADAEAGAGADSGDDDPSRLGLVPEWQMEDYLTIREQPPRPRGCITRFGRVAIEPADVLVLGALTDIDRSRPRFDSASLAVLQVLAPAVAIDDDAPRAIPSVVRLYSPEKGFFDAMEHEQVFALRAWSVRGSFHVVTNFAIDPPRRQQQLAVVRELVALEGIKDMAERKQRLKQRALQGVADADEWVANVWGLQLANLCIEYPLLFDVEDFTRLRRLEVDLVTRRPTFSGAIRGVTTAIAGLIAARWKREWVAAIRGGVRARQLAALEAYRDVVVSSYRSAFNFVDRMVLNTLRADETDPVVLTGLQRLDAALRTVLEEE